MDYDIKFPLDNLIPEIVSEENMGESFDYVISHLEHPRQREMYRPKRLTIIESLRREIGAGSFRIVRSDVRANTIAGRRPLCGQFPRQADWRLGQVLYSV